MLKRVTPMCRGSVAGCDVRGCDSRRLLSGHWAAAQVDVGV